MSTSWLAVSKIGAARRNQVICFGELMSIFYITRGALGYTKGKGDEYHFDAYLNSFSKVLGVKWNSVKSTDIAIRYLGVAVQDEAMPFFQSHILQSKMFQGCMADYEDVIDYSDYDVDVFISRSPLQGGREYLWIDLEKVDIYKLYFMMFTLRCGDDQWDKCSKGLASASNLLTPDEALLGLTIIQNLYYGNRFGAEGTFNFGEKSRRGDHTLYPFSEGIGRSMILEMLEEGTLGSFYKSFSETHSMVGLDSPAFNNTEISSRDIGRFFSPPKEYLQRTSDLVASSLSMPYPATRPKGFAHEVKNLISSLKKGYLQMPEVELKVDPIQELINVHYA